MRPNAASDAAATAVDVARSARGVAYVATGQSLLLVCGLLGTVFLARLLNPAHFGIYVMVSFVILKLNALAECGLGARIIHDNVEPDVRRLRSLFTLHCLLAGAAYVAAWLAAPGLTWILGLDADTVTFWRVLATLILVQPLKSIPVALLGRRMRYDALMAVEVTEGVIYQIVAIAMAVRLENFWSFGVGACVATATAVILVNWLAPWRIGFAWDRAYVYDSLRFGGALQLSSLTAVARDNAIILIAGPLFGPTAVGLLNWGLRLAWTCTQTYVGIATKISFALLSRMRDDRRLFTAALERILKYVNLVTFATLAVVVGLAPDIVELVFTAKWLDAVPLFYFFAVRMVVGNYTTLLDLALKALGFPERSLRVLSLWTLWEWVLAIIALMLFGYPGIAIAAGIGIWPALLLLRREVTAEIPLRLFAPTSGALAAGVVTCTTLLLLRGHARSLSELAAYVAVGIAVYVVTASVVEGVSFWHTVRTDLRRVMGGVPVVEAQRQ